MPAIAVTPCARAIDRAGLAHSRRRLTLATRRDRARKPLATLSALIAPGHPPAGLDRLVGGKRELAIWPEFDRILRGDILCGPGPLQFVWGTHGMVDQTTTCGRALWKLGG